MLRDSNGGANHTIPVSNGVLRPPHIERIGPAFPLFLKLEDMVTAAAGSDGLVLGGKPITDSEVGNALGVHRNRVLEWRHRLERWGYISTKRTSRGLVVRVHRSKKLIALKARSDARNSNIRASRGVENPYSDVGNSCSDARKSVHADQTFQDVTVTKEKETPQSRGIQPSRSRNDDSDPRHQPIIDRYFVRNRERCVEPDFDASDAWAVARWLRNSRLPLGEILRRLDNAFDSSDPYPLRPGFRLREFVAHSAKYAHGPIHKRQPVSLNANAENVDSEPEVAYAKL